MHIRVASLFLLGGVVWVAGCGAGPTSTFTCDQNARVGGKLIHQCSEWIVPQSDLQKSMQACGASGATTSFDPCRTTGALGRCDGIVDGQTKATVWLFRDDFVQTEAGAEAKCRNLGGQLTVLGSARELFASCETTSECPSGAECIRIGTSSENSTRGCTFRCDGNGDTTTCGPDARCVDYGIPSLIPVVCHERCGGDGDCHPGFRCYIREGVCVSEE